MNDENRLEASGEKSSKNGSKNKNNFEKNKLFFIDMKKDQFVLSQDIFFLD